MKQFRVVPVQTHRSPYLSMKWLLRAVCALLVLNCAIRAQEADDSDDDDDNSEIVDSSPDFSDLVIYVPKHTVTIGFRSLSGAKTGFNSSAIFGGLNPRGADSGADLDHYYHDGYVLAPTGTITDSAGNVVPVPSDGTTKNWRYANDNQVTDSSSKYVDSSGNEVFVGSGYVAMHDYVVDSTGAKDPLKQDSKGTFGVEVASAYQMGRILGSKVTWQLVGGLSMNDLSSAADRSFAGKITTYTDYYSLNGAHAPGAQTSPNSAVVDTPAGRHESIGTGQLKDHYNLRGAYMTFRAGPTVVVPLFKHFSASFSAGAVLVYAGTNYSVTEIFEPDSGDFMADNVSDGASAFLPGFYFDANVQWDLTNYSGFYLGAVYQSSGSYTQTIESSATSTDSTTAVQQNLSKYTTRVDLASLQGFRAGFMLKF